MVVLSDILSHVGNPMQLLHNALQVLKDDGLIILTLLILDVRELLKNFINGMV